MMMRKSFLLGLSMMCWPMLVVHAQAPLTETKLMNYVQRNSHLVELKQAQQRMADIQLSQAGRWADPRLELTHESIDRADQTERETSVWIKQDLSPWGSRELKKQLTAQQNQQQKLTLNAKQNGLRLQLRQLFYRALVSQQQLDVLNRYHAQLSEMANHIEQRWRQGDVSKLDLLRIQNELQTIETEQNALTQILKSAQKSLVSWLERPINQLDGELLPKPSAQPNFDLQKNPQLQQITLDLTQSAIAQQLAEKQRYWPDFSVGVGYKQSNEVGSSGGLKVGLEMSLPLFSQKKNAVQLAQTQRQFSEVEKAWLRKSMQVKLNQHLNQLKQYTNQATRWRSLIETQNRPMVAMTQASYRAGELTVSELLDVYRSELNHHKNYLAAAHQAREHHIQIQNLLGE
ncbi:MAG: TolC family protein [Hydrogenovibrio sp.]|uniref:TolC family protein n=1 Tax=Hydrogenovibrio sp. TaxID=2065821 RepID=UPI0028705AC0|nr:TolC family protein [Hydrogenovibrio sp.]MDR9499876.1 TolC family protein [Hydrogenovibrio sp.]